MNNGTKALVVGAGVFYVTKPSTGNVIPAALWALLIGGLAYGVMQGASANTPVTPAGG